MEKELNAAIDQALKDDIGNYDPVDSFDAYAEQQRENLYTHWEAIDEEFKDRFDELWDDYYRQNEEDWKYDFENL